MIWKRVRSFDGAFFARFMVTCRACGHERTFSEVLWGGKCLENGDYFCRPCTEFKRPRYIESFFVTPVPRLDPPFKEKER